MVGVTSVGPFSLTNQIGERDRFYQMFSPKTNFCVRDYRVLYGGSKVSRQFQLRSRQFQFHHGNFNFTTAISVSSRVITQMVMASRMKASISDS